jgi:hypothetical protein
VKHPRAANVWGLVGVELATLLAAAIAAWWLIGDVSETRTNADFLVRPPDLAPGTVRVLGVLAIALLAGCVAALLRWDRRGVLPNGWWPIEASILLTGLVAGSAMRVVTSGVSGANIGGALLLYLLPLPLLAALVWATAQSVRVLRSATGVVPDRRTAGADDFLGGTKRY